MKFVHPEILWALTALSIPIIVHLFNFRKFRRVDFPSIAFLKEIRQETKSKSRLKHLLILFSRLLALSAIILAFAQPYFPRNAASAIPGQKAVAIYIDNSFSTQGSTESGPVLEISKSKAIEVVNAYNATDRFLLLTNDFEGRHQRLVGREEIIPMIQEIGYSPATRTMSEVFAKQRDLLNNSGLTSKSAYHFTDLQKSSIDPEQIANDTSIAVRIVPSLAAAAENLYIDSAWFDTPVRLMNQPETLNIRVVNTGDSRRENVPVSLRINGQVKMVSAATVDAKGSSVVPLTYANTEPGFKHAQVSLEDYPLVFDNVLFLAYQVQERATVLNIRASQTPLPDPVETLFSDDPSVVLQTVGEGSVDYGTLGSRNLIVLNQIKTPGSGLVTELKKFVESGGSLLIIPSAESDINAYNQLLSAFNLGSVTGWDANPTKVTGVNEEHYLLRNVISEIKGNVDLPVVQSMLSIERNPGSMSEAVLTTLSGKPFFLASPAGRGRVYMSAVSLNPEESTLTSNWFFPAALVRVAEYSQPASELTYQLGSDEPVLLRNVSLHAEETFRFRNIESSEEVIPEHRTIGGNTYVYLPDNIKEAGNYEISLGTNAAGVAALNFAHEESDTRVITEEELSASFESLGMFNFAAIDGTTENIGKLATENTEEKKHWYTFIVLSLIFLAIEVLLIKFWR
ncbi:MAG: hypothetical protein RL220_835 [Bacteroidota bacterium]